MKDKLIIIRHGEHDPESDSGKHFAAKEAEATRPVAKPETSEAYGLTERGREMAEQTGRAIMEMSDTDKPVE